MKIFNFFTSRKSTRAGKKTGRKQSDPRQRRSAKLWKERLRRYGIASLVAVLAIWLGTLGFVSGSFSKFGNWAQNGLTQQFYQQTANAGFKVNDILVHGRTHTDADTLLATLDIEKGVSVFSVDLEEARRKLEEISWIDRARLARRLPDTIYVEIKEHTPVALWQFKKELSVIDQNGLILTTENLDTFKHLPLVVGADAPEHVVELLALMQAEPEIADYLEAAVRIGSRRWDLRLKNGLRVKLPEENVELALRKLVKAQEDENLFERNISSVDLRLPDKMIVDTAETETTTTKKQKSI